jgi:hypothetical protein
LLSYNPSPRAKHQSTAWRITSVNHRNDLARFDVRNDANFLSVDFRIVLRA